MKPGFIFSSLASWSEDQPFVRRVVEKICVTGKISEQDQESMPAQLNLTPGRPHTFPRCSRSFYSTRRILFWRKRRKVLGQTGEQEEATLQGWIPLRGRVRFIVNSRTKLEQQQTHPSRPSIADSICGCHLQRRTHTIPSFGHRVPLMRLRDVFGSLSVFPRTGMRSTA